MQIKRRTSSTDGGVDFAGFDPLLSRMLRSRGIHSATEVDHQLKQLPPFADLLDIDIGVRLLATALAKEQRIVIVGDYDADGATSTALAMRALGWMGCHDLRYLVPNRFTMGYGLSVAVVEQAIAAGAELLITVDNGIANIDGVARAKEAGINVVITDHHLPGEVLPAADAIINPNRVGDRFPSKALAGVGVIFYLMLALRSHLRASGWFVKQGLDEPNLAHLLDLVALGTVADLVPLDKVNRILVQQGIQRIRQGHCSAGIKALIKIAKRDSDRLTTQDFGYGVGPRLNAAGRMDDMRIGIETLLAENDTEASRLATELDRLNQERRETSEQMELEAAAVMEKMQGLLEGNVLPTGIVLYDPEWHEGVIGILASRIKERYHRPVLICTLAEDGVVKCSGRSIAGMHLRDALAAIDSAHPAMLDKFGGHAMAAGLSLAAEYLPTLATTFDQEAGDRLSPEQLEQDILSDGPLMSGDLTPNWVDMLYKSIPWGQTIEPPQFDGSFELLSFRWLKGEHLKMRLRWQNSSDEVDAIYFYASGDGIEPVAGTVEIVYKPDINRWNGRTTIQLIVNYLRIDHGL